MKRLAFLIAFILGLAASTGAYAQVVLTFAVSRVEGLGVAHGYLRMTGTTESGETIHRVFGFSAFESGMSIPFGRAVQGGVTNRAESTIGWDQIQPYLSVQIPDKTLEHVIERFGYWNDNQNGGYQLYSRNCIHFLGDIAETVGLKVPRGRALDPVGFMSDLARLNPPGSAPGIIDTPLANPNPAQIDVAATVMEIQAAGRRARRNAAAEADVPQSASPPEADPTPPEPELTPN